VATKSVNPDGGATPGLTIHYDGAASGLTATVPLPAAASPPVWHKVRVSLTDRKVYVDGTLSAGTVSFAPTGQDLTRLEIDGTGTIDGEIAIDEISLTTPIAQWGAGAQFSGTWNIPGAIWTSGTFTILKDATISASGYARSPGFVSLAGQDRATTLGSSVQAGATLLDTRLEGNFSIAGSNDSGGNTVVSTSGGHTVTFPAAGGPVQLTDSFQRDYSPTQPQLFRKDLVTARIPSVLGISLSTQASFPGALTTGGTSGSLQQLWNWTLASTWPGPFALQLGASLTDTSSFALQAAASYPVEWIRAYRYVLPWSADPNAARTGKATADMTLSLGRLTPTLSLLSTYQTAYSPSGNAGSVSGQQLSEAKIVFSLPITLIPPAAAGAAPAVQPTGDVPPWARSNPAAVPAGGQVPGGLLSGLTLTPSYSRDLQVAGLPALGWNDLVAASTASPSSVTDFRLFGNDIGFFGRSIWGQSYFFQSIPGVDVFLPGLAADFARASTTQSYALYSPTVALALSRSIGSSPWDLVVPNRIQLSTGRSLTRQGDSVSDSRTIGASITNTAINIFGRLGAYPIFPFYRSESISSSVDMSFTSDTTTTGLSWSLYHLLNATVNVTGEDSVILNNSFSVDVQPSNVLPGTDTTQAGTTYSDTGQLAYTWRTHPQDLFGIPALHAALAAGAYLAHREELSANWTSAPLSSNLTFTVGHSTAFTLPKNGDVSVFAKLGFGLSPYSTQPGSGQIVALGLQIGISGRLTF
jgi:hypothetical protein